MQTVSAYAIICTNVCMYVYMNLNLINPSSTVTSSVRKHHLHINVPIVKP